MSEELVELDTSDSKLSVSQLLHDNELKEHSFAVRRVLELAQRQTGAVKSLKEQLRSSQAQLVATTEDNLGLMKELNDMSKQKDMLEKKFNKTNKQLQKLRDKKAVTDKELESVKEDYELTSAERSQLAEDRDDLRDELQRTLSKLEDLAQEHSKCEGEQKSSREILSETHALEQEVLRAQRDDHKKEIEKLRGQLVELRNERLQLASQLAAAAEKIRDLETRAKSSSELADMVKRQQQRMSDVREALKEGAELINEQDSEYAQLEVTEDDSPYIDAMMIKIKANDAFNTNQPAQLRSIQNSASKISASRRSASLHAVTPDGPGIHRELARLLVLEKQKRTTPLEEAIIAANTLRASQATVLSDTSPEAMAAVRKDHRSLGEVMTQLKTLREHNAEARTQMIDTLSSTGKHETNIPPSEKLSGDDIAHVVGALHGKVSYLRRTCDAAVGAIEEDQSAMDALWNLIISLLDNIGMLGRRIEVMQGELDEAKIGEVEVTDAEREDLAQRTSWFQKEERENEIQQIKEELEALMSQTRKNQVDNTEIDKLRDLLKDREEQYEADLALTREIETAFLRLKSTIKKGGKKERKAQRELEMEVRDLREQVRELEFIEESLMKRNKVMEEEINALSEQTTDAADVHLIAANKTLHEQMVTLDEEVDRLRGELAAAEEELDDLEERCQAERQEAAALRTKVTEERDRLAWEVESLTSRAA